MNNIHRMLFPRRWQAVDVSSYGYDVIILWQNKRVKERLTKQKISNLCGISLDKIEKALTTDNLRDLNLEELELKNKQRFKFWKKAFWKRKK